MPYIVKGARVANFLVDSFSGDAIETQFNMQIPVGSPAAVLVFIDGVRQATESYAVGGVMDLKLFLMTFLQVAQ